MPLLSVVEGLEPPIVEKCQGKTPTAVQCVRGSRGRRTGLLCGSSKGWEQRLQVTKRQILAQYRKGFLGLRVVVVSCPSLER